MDGDIVKTFIDKLDVSFSYCVFKNTFAKVAFTVTLLSSNTYTWYTTRHYAIVAGHANRLIWEDLKSDLQLYFKPPDYAY